MPGGSISILDVATDLASGVPSWVVNSANPPDVFFDFAGDLAWKKTGGILTPVSSLFTVSRASSKWVNNSAGLWSSVSPNVLARSNLGGTFEEPRTNLNIFSQGFSSAPWTAAAVSLTGAQPSPDGGSNAYVLTDLATTAQHALTSTGVTITGGVTYTSSVFVKAGTGPVGAAPVSLMVANAAFSNNFRALFDPTTGAISGQASSGTGAFTSASSVVYPNGWVRCIVTGTLDPADTQAKPTFYFNSGNSYLGVGSTLSIWQAQLEAGASATSPIVTSGSTATRNADVDTLTSPGTFGAAYTLYAKGTPQAPTTFGSDQVALQVDDGSGNNRFSVRRQGGSGVGLYSNSTASVLTTGGASVWAQNSNGKIAAATAAGDQAVSFGGAAVSVGAAATPVGPISNVRIGSIQSGVAQFDGFLIEAAIWYAQRVPNAQLQSMTA